MSGDNSANAHTKDAENVQKGCEHICTHAHIYKQINMFACVYEHMYVCKY